MLVLFVQRWLNVVSVWWCASNQATCKTGLVVDTFYTHGIELILCVQMEIPLHVDTDSKLGTDSNHAVCKLILYLSPTKLLVIFSDVSLAYHSWLHGSDTRTQRRREALL